MSDVKSEGIITQFPEMFGSASSVGMPKTGEAQNTLPYLWVALMTSAMLAMIGVGLLLRRDVRLR